MSENIILVTDDTFESEVLQATQPVLVDFWADWCGPCKMLAPTLEDIAENYSTKIKFAKINVDENHDVPTKYNIRGIPTLLLFKEGKVVASKVGAITKRELTDFITSNT